MEDRGTEEILVGNALPIVRSMPDHCVTLVLTDPDWQNHEDLSLAVLAECERIADVTITLWGASPGKLRSILNSLDVKHIGVWYKPNGGCPTGGGVARRWEAWVVLFRWPKGEWKISDVQIFNRLTSRTGLPHIWQKPENLMEVLIRYGSNPGDTIFDPFCGTGTTQVVARRMGREAWGCEIDKDCVESITKPRLNCAYMEYMF